MRSRYLISGLLAASLLTFTACDIHQEPPKPQVPYQNLGYKPGLPEFMRGTIYERTEVSNDLPYTISAYSVVVNLQDTGDNSELPGTVRAALVKRLSLAGFGSHDNERYTGVQPEDVLNDKRVAVVEVLGRLPVGARKGQRFDIVVQAMPHSNTTSLAHGRLYRTELYNRGLEEPDSHGTTLAYADNGDIFVNPAYALLEGHQPSNIQASLRRGVVMGAGLVVQDRPIFLELRVPENRLAKAIEYRVINRFQQERDIPAAAAQDAGIVALYMPVSFNGDWQHFMAIVNHLYLNDTPLGNTTYARQLVLEARKPGAPLLDVSYCLEGLGPTAVPLYSDLIQDPDANIAYCGARAAACVGDHGGIRALVEMAIDPSCSYQLAAVHTLGQLPQSPSIDRQLEALLSSDQRLVRIEAYKILAAHNDRLIVTENIGDHFLLDYVDCHGPPLVYATVEGLPRLAVFGQTTNVATPLVFMAMDQRLSITSNPGRDRLTIFYRDPMKKDPVNVMTRTSLIDLVARLGGISAPGDDRLDFSYGDVVSILQTLSSSHMLMGLDDTGAQIATALMLEPPPELAAIEQVPSVGPSQRPQGGPAPTQTDPMLPPGHGPAPDFSNPGPRPSGGPEAKSGAPVPSFGQ